MTFQAAEETYKELRSQHASGKLSDPDFEAQVNQLKVQDAQGHWWQLGVRTGEWYYNDGHKWVRSESPTISMPESGQRRVSESNWYEERESWRRESLPLTAYQPAPTSTPSPETRQLQIAIIVILVLIILGLIVFGLRFIAQ